MSTTALWVFFMCYGPWCTGSDTRIIPGMTEDQCRELQRWYQLVPGDVGDHRTRGFRYVNCIGPSELDGHGYVSRGLEEAEKKKAKKDTAR
jgi:hypothetical protein